MTQPPSQPASRSMAGYGSGLSDRPMYGPAPDSLADVLERVLDKGIVIAGDIKVNLLDIELLTIKIRLLVVSVDKAMEMGIDWWRRDPMLSSGEQDLEEEIRELRRRLQELEAGREGDEEESDG
jgi:hypothetical protein